MKKNQHVMHRESDGKWIVKGENNSRATRVLSTQKEAISAGREISKKQRSELIVHGRDGQIQDKWSYGNDPRNIKG